MTTTQASLESLKLQLTDIAMKAPPPGEERKQVLAAAKDLVLALEYPEDVIERICFGLLETSAIKAATELGIFKVLADEAGPHSAADISKLTNSDPVLIGRIMRCLAAYGAAKEVREEGYSSTMVSNTFANTRNAAALETCFDLLASGWLKLPQHLKDLNYKNPHDNTDTSLAKANNVTGPTPFEIFFASPHLTAFGLYMGTFALGHKQWTDLYPVQERLIEGFEDGEESVMFVDVGGGFGHQAKLLKDTFTDIPGRFIVQDLEQMKGKDIPGVEFQVHDFYQEQPVKGARLYYLRFIMHDYDFTRNVKTLINLRRAMKPGYSRLIVNEWIIPERNAPRFMTAMDMNMMCLSGMERTEKQYRELIEAAGLRIERIYYGGDSLSESVIEAAVA